MHKQFRSAQARQRAYPFPKIWFSFGMTSGIGQDAFHLQQAGTCSEEQDNFYAHAGICGG